MKFTLAKTEVQGLLAKAMGIPAEAVSIIVKELVVDVTQSIENLSFASAIVAPAVVVQEVTEELPEDDEAEEAPVKAKAKAKTKAKAKPAPVEEEEIVTEEEIAEDEDDIDFL